MANKNETSAVEIEPAVQTQPVQTESVYTADELVANFKAFKTSKEIVKIALWKAKKRTATFNEAKAIVDNFRTKEVK